MNISFRMIVFMFSMFVLASSVPYHFRKLYINSEFPQN